MNIASILTIGFFLSTTLGIAAQNVPLDKENRNRALEMLHEVHDDIKQHYYSSTFNGFDIDARFNEAKSKIETAATFNYALSDIAAAVAALDDSHTFFLPPPRPYTHDYGWRMKLIGASDCFITSVRPGSDAEKKGLRPGDAVLKIADYD